MITINAREQQRGEQGAQGAVVVIGFRALRDDLFGSFLEGDPLPAVGIITGIAPRVIRDHVIYEIFVVRGEELMGLARGEEK